MANMHTHLTKPEKRLIAMILGVLLATVIVAGAGYGIYATTTENVPLEGGNEWMDVPLEGGNEWMDMPVEGGNAWLDLPLEGGNEWIKALPIASYEMDTDDYGKGYVIPEISTFAPDAQELTLHISLDETLSEKLQKWFKDTQQDAPESFQAVRLRALSADGDTLMEWHLEDTLLINLRDSVTADEEPDVSLKEATLWFQVVSIRETH